MCSGGLGVGASVTLKWLISPSGTEPVSWSVCKVCSNQGCAVGTQKLRLRLLHKSSICINNGKRIKRFVTTTWIIRLVFRLTPIFKYKCHGYCSYRGSGVGVSGWDFRLRSESESVHFYPLRLHLKFLPTPTPQPWFKRPWCPSSLSLYCANSFGCRRLGIASDVLAIPFCAACFTIALMQGINQLGGVFLTCAVRQPAPCNRSQQTHSCRLHCCLLFFSLSFGIIIHIHTSMRTVNTSPWRHERARLRNNATDVCSTRCAVVVVLSGDCEVVRHWDEVANIAYNMQVIHNNLIYLT
jgi:hypothetical protein